jgi:alkyl sulfatase BDS1-like metallo-beta-lactamase superfamily hydrolase
LGLERARLGGPRVWNTRIVLAWHFTDVQEQWSVTVANGALSVVAGRLSDDAHAKVTLTSAAFDAVLLSTGDAAEQFSSGAIAVEGDGAKLGELLGLLDDGDPSSPSSLRNLQHHLAQRTTLIDRAQRVSGVL